MGLCFKVSGLHKIPQRPAFSLFSSINNLLLLCFSLQSKEKHILYIKIERSIAERSVMAFSGAQSILSGSKRGLTGHKQFLPVHPPPLLRPCVREGVGVTGPQLCLSRCPYCPSLREFVSRAVSFLFMGLFSFHLDTATPKVRKAAPGGGEPGSPQPN